MLSVYLELDCYRSICRIVSVKWLTSWKTDTRKVSVVSGNLYERHIKGNANHRERPRRDIKPSKRYIDEEWVPLRQKQTVMESKKPDELCLSAFSSHSGSKKLYSVKLSSHSSKASRSSKSSETRTQLRLYELKLLQAKRESEQEFSRNDGWRRRSFEDVKRTAERIATY